MTDNEMRAVILKWFRDQQAPSYRGSTLPVWQQLGAIAHSMALLNHGQPSGSNRPVFWQEEQWHFHDVAWQLVLEGILRPDKHFADLERPSYYLTAYGRKVIQDESTPYDPDGYFSRLREKAPKLDPIVVLYLEEALKTFRVRCALSSAVCLGCASERSFAVVCMSFCQTLDAAAKVTFENKMNKERVRTLVKSFNHAFETKLSAKADFTDLDPKVHESFEGAINGLFDVIRIQRNNAGHPTGTKIDINEVGLMLAAFPSQLEAMYRMIEYFDAKKKP